MSVDETLTNHVCDVDALWLTLDGDVLWTSKYCPDCEARWVYNRNPGSAVGRWYTWAQWMRVLGREPSQNAPEDSR